MPRYIPGELTDLIIDNAGDDKEELAQLALVSHQWAPRAQTLLFKVLDVQFNNGANKYFDEFIAFCSTHPHLTWRVADVCLGANHNDNYSALVSVCNLVHLVRLLPNLVNLIIEGAKIWDHCDLRCTGCSSRSLDLPPRHFDTFSFIDLESSQYYEDPFLILDYVSSVHLLTIVSVQWANMEDAIPVGEVTVPARTEVMCKHLSVSLDDDSDPFVFERLPLTNSLQDLTITIYDNLRISWVGRLAEIYHGFSTLTVESEDSTIRTSRSASFITRSNRI